MSYVYGLYDPRNEQIRYVGVTTRELAKRLCWHMKERGKSHKVNWIMSLTKQGVEPCIRQLEFVPDELGSDVLFGLEKEWIRSLKDAGVKLVNGNDGGRGGQRGSKGRLGISLTADHKQHVADATSLMWQDSEYVSKQLASRNTDEYKQHQRELAASRSHADSAKEKVSIFQKELWKTEEHRTKVRAARMARTHCKRGHEFTEENSSYLSNGERRCRQCQRDNVRRFSARKKQQAK